MFEVLNGLLRFHMRRKKAQGHFIRFLVKIGVAGIGKSVFRIKRYDLIRSLIPKER